MIDEDPHPTLEKALFGISISEQVEIRLRMKRSKRTRKQTAYINKAKKKFKTANEAWLFSKLQDAMTVSEVDRQLTSFRHQLDWRTQWWIIIHRWRYRKLLRTK